MSYKQINNSPVFLVGDLHNNYKNFKQAYEERNLKDSYFIFLGDTSIAREEQFYQFTKLDKLFEKIREVNIIDTVINTFFIWLSPLNK